jgi:hypothetical protein
MLGQECLKQQNHEENIRSGGKTVYVVFKDLSKSLLIKGCETGGVTLPYPSLSPPPIFSSVPWKFHLKTIPYNVKFKKDLCHREY